jgi:hypothetical protein
MERINVSNWESYIMRKIVTNIILLQENGFFEVESKGRDDDV